jgi:hypothetical protein
MSWTLQYWDALDNIYWYPEHIGLKSIPQRFWTKSDKAVSIPRDMVNPNGPLYRRLRPSEEYWKIIKRQEEIFNHMFSLTFAVLPGDVISEVLSPFIQAKPDSYYELVNRELMKRYGWEGRGNLTQPDSFFVSNQSIVAIELKFNAVAELNQLAKYLMLFVGETLRNKNQPSLDLIYVFNKAPAESFKKKIKRDFQAVDSSMCDILVESLKNHAVSDIIKTHESEFRDYLNRVNINCITWKDFYDRLEAYSDGLSQGKGDRTLKRLINGLMTELVEHPLSNVAVTER